VLHITECIFLLYYFVCLLRKFEKRKETYNKYIRFKKKKKKKRKSKSECALDFQVEVYLSDDRQARAAVPSGASTGKLHAHYDSLYLIS
jgi:hypothetical protein